MTPAGEILRGEIRREGPVPFRRFMEVALYHPEFGYYRRPRDPFGAGGDFYTAEQLQPVFGMLIARRIAMLREAMGVSEEFTVVELGAGRAEMAEALREFRYLPVDVATGKLPSRMRGVILTNEFFDSLPVHAAVMRSGVAKEMRVGFDGDQFTWVEDGPLPDEAECYRRGYLGALSDGQMFEVNLEAIGWLERMAAALEEGYVFTIDYGYTSAELARFPAGTLMSYRRHQALDDVLKDPGEQDITAHVCFTALEEHGRRVGLETVTLRPLAQTILEAGETDQFAGALAAGSPAEQRRRTLQLKQLLVGMGETFRTLVQRRVAEQ